MAFCGQGLRSGQSTLSFSGSLEQTNTFIWAEFDIIVHCCSVCSLINIRGNNTSGLILHTVTRNISFQRAFTVKQTNLCGVDCRWFLYFRRACSFSEQTILQNFPAEWQVKVTLHHRPMCRRQSTCSADIVCGSYSFIIVIYLPAIENVLCLSQLTDAVKQTTNLKPLTSAIQWSVTNLSRHSWDHLPSQPLGERGQRHPLRPSTFPLHSTALLAFGTSTDNSLPLNHI